jgi:Domain of unknown function (DUF397)
MHRSHRPWRKSSYSSAHAHCVEVATPSAGPRSGRSFLVRDSKDPDGPVLAFGQRAWRSLIAGIKDGSVNGAA